MTRPETVRGAGGAGCDRTPEDIDFATRRTAWRRREADRAPADFQPDLRVPCRKFTTSCAGRGTEQVLLRRTAQNNGPAVGLPEEVDAIGDLVLQAAGGRVMAVDQDVAMHDRSVVVLEPDMADNPRNGGIDMGDVAVVKLAGLDA